MERTVVRGGTTKDFYLEVEMREFCACTVGAKYHHGAPEYCTVPRRLPPTVALRFPATYRNANPSDNNKEQCGNRVPSKVPSV